MKKIIIDANILISFVTDRNLRQQKMAAILFEEASRFNTIVMCPQNVLTEFTYVMDKIYEVEHKNIKTILNDLVSMPGLEIIHELNVKQLLTYWPKYFDDFGDAIVASVCREIKGAAIATFDRKFINSLKKAGIEVYAFD